MNLKSLLFAAFAAALSCTQAFGQATIMPPGETCFSALAPTSGGPANTGTGFIGLLGTITGGSSYTNGSYGGVALTGGSGTGATANITVSGAAVTQVAIINPGANYVAGDVLSAPAASIGGTGAGFSVPVSSVAINYALAGGTVGFYIPNTLTFKQTWQDSAETTLNQNPVPLDANGCAVIYGSGIYRMILKDASGNTVYDKLTASTGPAGIFWAGNAGGTGNAITVVDTAFAFQDGTTIQFRAQNTNTGPATLAVSGNVPTSIVKDTSAGPIPLSGGEIGIGNTPMMTYDAVANEFHIVNPSSTSSSGSASGVTPPQGYLNLVGAASGSVIQNNDVIGAATVYYSPYTGNQIPIWNGSSFALVSFSELTTTLTAAGSPSTQLQDACVFSNNGVPTLVIGPSWSSPTNRGTGAGTPQLTRLNGIWVNAVQIVGYNGISSYTIPASQCTYVGTIWIDVAAGQVSAYRSVGQNRKFGIWNAYNRQTIVLQLQDPTASWPDGGGNRWIVSDNGNGNNVISTLMGLSEEEAAISFTQLVTFPALTGVTAQAAISIGINSTSSPTGFCTASPMTFNPGSASSVIMGATLNARCTMSTSLGVVAISPLQNPSTNGTVVTVTYSGSALMLMTVQYRG